jgi:leucyl aminopeptidase
VQVDATTQPAAGSDADTIALGLFDDQSAGNTGHGVVDALIRRGEARARFGHLAVAHEQGRRLIVVGLGARDEFGPERARRAAAAAHRRATELSTRTLCWVVPPPARAEVVTGLVEGTLLHAYRFDRYKPAPEDRAELERLVIASTEDFSERAREAAIVATAQNRARDLGNTPGNDLPPAALADYALGLAERHPEITVEVMDGEQIRAAGMGAFAAVAQGSAESARLIRIEYEGADAGPERVAYVGKGITFDSGGISLKPPATMHEMKFDMLGGAAVIEAIAALAELGAPVRVLGLVGASENLPSGTAVKPGDIVRALDGTTIEVNNTDAEGRLVLADCLCYARQLGCDEIVDIATLTGAVQVALGSVYAGVMANDGDWAHRVEEAAKRAGEPVWRLPLHADYAEMVKGRYAQLTNRAERREAMAITAAELLHHFVGDVPWAHIDIAGTAWDIPRPYYVGKGATGFGVRLLVELARSGLRRESSGAAPGGPRP